MVKLYLDLETVDEPRGFIKTLLSLKYLLDEKIAKETEGMQDPKEKASKARNMREELHAMMDQQLKDRAHHFQYYRGCNDMDSYWNSWSIAVEKAGFNTLGPTKNLKKLQRDEANAP